jgi:hypothetical protein
MSKQPIRAAEAVPVRTDIRFTMEGLRQDFNEDNVFVLTADFNHVNLSEAFDSLVKQGISEQLADEAVAGMAEFIFGRQLGEYFARKMVRK